MDKYAECIDGNQAYVVSEALKLLFKKEFKRWPTHEQHQPGASRSRRSYEDPRNKHEALFNPIRHAREYNALQLGNSRPMPLRG